MQKLEEIRLKDFMIRDVIYLKSTDTMVEAYEKMNLFGIRHLPVLDENENVVGVFTQTDLNHACPPRETESGWQYSKSELSSRVLKHFINKEPVVLSAEDSLGEAASAMARNKINCIPVVAPDTRKLAGFITHVDVLKKIGEILN